MLEIVAFMQILHKMARIVNLQISWHCNGVVVN